MSLAATVIIPTTGDRGPLLPLSVGSALAQSERALEVFVIGDGVTDATRAVVRDLAAGDTRVRFFDKPKHPRRGEEYRHAALAEARGEIVCYLTDRDLMLPHHVATLARLLAGADLAYTLRVCIGERELEFVSRFDVTDPDVRRRMLACELPIDLPLSCTAHRLDFYRLLPFGWRTTPRHWFTDQYMWHQFLDRANCRVASSAIATVLYFKRGDHPGWPVERRLAELERWRARMAEPDLAARFQSEAVAALVRDQGRLALAARRRLKTRVRSFLYRSPVLGEAVLAGSLGATLRRLWRRLVGPMEGL
jgi:glycosyltransferase involved in cell wall biosynthesis